MKELTTRQAAEKLGVSPYWITRLVQFGELVPARKIGTAYLYAPEEVARYGRERRPVGRPAVKGGK